MPSFHFFNLAIKWAIRQISRIIFKIGKKWNFNKKNWMKNLFQKEIHASFFNRRDNRFSFFLPIHFTSSNNNYTCQWGNFRNMSRGQPEVILRPDVRRDVIEYEGARGTYRGIAYVVLFTDWRTIFEVPVPVFWNIFWE